MLLLRTTPTVAAVDRKATLVLVVPVAALKVAVVVTGCTEKAAAAAADDVAVVVDNSNNKTPETRRSCFTGCINTTCSNDESIGDVCHESMIDDIDDDDLETIIADYRFLP